MTIKGHFETDDNFSTVYSDGKIYTIAKNGEWGFIPIGGRDIAGNVLTRTEYNKRLQACDRFGTFELN